MKNNKDDRTDNVDRIQCNIDNTIQNVRLANDVIEKTSDEKMKKTLESKNQLREEALAGMKKEIKEEAMAKENNYK
ncbi:small acid-soluble spore protein Tlp [Clostridium grantii]|uniref:Protein Tlp homolog n=1 Tax=Clostridium grantii DSM 8605 TaxID=1121316 RepID=A0A1M5S6N1_9CLOT|nr:small acid-soluble spore protein Tlp [Clostridium grantii]SHH34257.1 small acid-soluble spore protein (thioredoxin-like protein) [Clostridium grantii DSM 8605]